MQVLFKGLYGRAIKLTLLAGTFLYFVACSSDDPGTPDIPPDPGVDNAVSGVISLDKFGTEILAYYNADYQFHIAYHSETTSGEQLELSYIPGAFPIIFRDETESTWSVFGICESGDNQGKRLKRPSQMTGFWFAISSMFAEVTLYSESNLRNRQITSGEEGWAVDPDLVFLAAPKDAIPAIDEPEFTFFPKPVDFESNFLEDNERVAVVLEGNEIYVMPIPVLNWHEIVNIDGKNEVGTLSYCPLTGTTVHYNPALNKGVFGVSGFLYNNNLIMFDRDSENLWSQMTLTGIRGSEINTSFSQLPVWEMTWAGAKLLKNSMYFLDPGEKYGRDYSIHPYGDYDTNDNDVTFSLTYKDERLPEKERVLAIELASGTVVIQASDYLP